MGDKAPFIIKILLYPLSILYGIGVYVRNRLFDLQILKSREFRIPVISVGNITVGGTGKTPHIEYLIELLSPEYKVAVLSRGYKRKSKGFFIADENTPVSFIGDEPWQLKEKYPQIKVAVDSDRVHGIETLIKEIPELDLVLLDDAFQHRYVKPGINILLIDFNRSILEDHLLPLGRLRESSSERYRADIVIYSKSPKSIAPIEKRLLINRLKMQACQSAFFTSIYYKELQPLMPGGEPMEFQSFSAKKYSVLLVAGIANPGPLIDELKKYTENMETILYPDHHFFDQTDLKNIQDRFDSLAGENKLIVTTEKDAARLKEFASIMAGEGNWYYVPIKICFHPGDAENFNKHIFHYVAKNNRNSILYKR